MDASFSVSDRDETSEKAPRSSAKHSEVPPRLTREELNSAIEQHDYNASSQ